MARPGFMVRHAILDILAGTPPEVVGAYVLIHQYAARKNLSGCIVGAKHWTEGTWLSACRCRKRHVEALVAAGGAEWKGDDLVLEEYDQEGQDRYGGAAARVALINERRRLREAKSSHEVVARSRGAKSWGGTAGAGARAEENLAPPPSVVLARDPAPVQGHKTDGGDGGDGYLPHDQPPEAIAATDPLPGPGHLTTAIAHRLPAVDAQDVRAAAKAGSLLGVVKAFGGNLAADRRAEWRREADDLSITMVVVLFARERAERKSIREPSGLRKARERQEDDPINRSDAEGLLAIYGLKPPAKAAAGAAP